MAEPSPNTPPDPRRPGTSAGVRALSAVALAAFAVSAPAGCGFVPKTRMDEARRVTQNLRAENNRLKDLALDLRSQNQDLSQRAVDDAQRLAAQDEAVASLEQNVHAYQEERNQLADAFEALKRQVQIAVAPGSAGAGASRTAAKPNPKSLVMKPADPLKTFAEAHPGWSFDAASGALTAEASTLFAPGGSTLTPDGEAAVKALGVAVKGSGRTGFEVVGHSASGGGSGVVKAGYSDDDPGYAAASGRFVAASRAAKLRDTLLASSGLDKTSVQLAEAPHATTAEAEAAEPGPDRIEVRPTAAPGSTEAPPSKAEAVPEGPPALDSPATPGR